MIQSLIRIRQEEQRGRQIFFSLFLPSCLNFYFAVCLYVCLSLFVSLCLSVRCSVFLSLSASQSDKLRWKKTKLSTHTLSFCLPSSYLSVCLCLFMCLSIKFSTLTFLFIYTSILFYWYTSTSISLLVTLHISETRSEGVIEATPPTHSLTHSTSPTQQ